ncbi:bile acid:sodium symporter family protein [Streptomyces sp. GS7]|uniref:bile acid:sodium symporter family protein n=1 Tax=Streptomyces sp. GS7 TaxID=2692234 RepID=UPI001F244DBD|nr:bile acid:sodium symporter family protein [Streptomyces sp. GS7]
MRRPVFRLPSWLPVDGFLLALVGTVGLAALLPAAGRAATVADGASTGAVALLFFLYGARLSTREAMDGLRHWRLHLTTLACTFVAFPVLGLAAGALVPQVLPPALYTGLLFLCLVPSTVQSSIAFTSIARGNVAAAICAGSFSSLVGIVLTPLLAGLVLHGAGAGFSAHSLISVACQLLLPFVAGQLLRRWIAGFLARHRKVLGRVDRGSILLVVYAAFSAGMVQGIWHQVSPLRLLCLLGVEAVLLAAMLTVTSYGSRLLGFPRADRIAITFAGSKKSLAAGLPMAGVLFGAQAGLAVLPLMLFHQMQLMVCAVLAKRYAAQVNAEEHTKDAQDVTANRTAKGTWTEPGNGIEAESVEAGSEDGNGTGGGTANEADVAPHFR